MNFAQYDVVTAGYASCENALIIFQREKNSSSEDSPEVIKLDKILNKKRQELTHEAEEDFDFDKPMAWIKEFKAKVETLKQSI